MCAAATHLIVVLAVGNLPAQAQWHEIQGDVGPDDAAVPMMAHDSTRGVCVLHFPLAGAEENRTWELVGSTWTFKGANDASSVGYAAVVFDSKRNLVIRFGGERVTGDAVGEVWEWTEGGWMFRGEGAPPRYLHAMAFDSSRGVSVLFGGVETNGGETLDDTWEYDGVEWTQLSSGVPSARDRHAMTFDTEHHVTLVHGGAQGLADLWSWDGKGWTLLDDGNGPNEPRNRFAHSLAFDTRRGVALLFWGYSLGDLTNDLWEWDGASWTKLNTPGAPSPRAYQAMVYDPGLHRLVMFGGQGDQGERLNDTWEYLLPPPPCYPDLDGSGSLDLFDFLSFINLFNLSDSAADCDMNQFLDFFDFLCFTNAFNAGC